METQYLQVQDLERDGPLLDRAAALLREGQLVAFPTETVYGLGGNALLPGAAKAIYAAKGRPSDNPLIVHIASLQELPPLVREVPEALHRLAARFWPGPMTVVLPKSDWIPYETSGGLDTVAIRMPSHPVARELIRRSGVPVAAPSANLSGSPSPTCAAHCVHDLDGRIAAIVDGGPCQVGVESTVLTLCGEPRVLRPGAVTLEMLRQVLPGIRYDPGVFHHLSDQAKVASPGMKYKHYAPKTRVVLVRGDREQFRRFLLGRQGALGVLCFEGDLPGGRWPVLTYGREHDPASQARQLFDALRRVDGLGVPVVYARVCGEEGIGQAVYNRLLRAAGFEEIAL